MPCIPALRVVAGKSVATYIAPLLYGFTKDTDCVEIKSVGCRFAGNVGIAVCKLYTFIFTLTLPFMLFFGTSSLAAAVRRHTGLLLSILHSWQQQALLFSACSPFCTLASIPTGTGTTQIAKTASNHLQPQVLTIPDKRHQKHSQVIFIPPSCIAVSHRLCTLDYTCYSHRQAIAMVISSLVNLQHLVASPAQLSVGL